MTEPNDYEQLAQICYEMTVQNQDGDIFSDNAASVYYEAILFIAPEHAGAKQRATELGNSYEHPRPAADIADDAFNLTGTLHLQHKITDTDYILTYLSLCLAIDPPHYLALTRMVKILCLSDDPEDAQEAKDIVDDQLEIYGETVQGQLLMADFMRYTEQTDSALLWVAKAHAEADLQKDNALLRECAIRAQRISDEVRAGTIPPPSDYIDTPDFPNPENN